jgi:hypothetical protein
VVFKLLGQEDSWRIVDECSGDVDVLCLAIWMVGRLTEELLSRLDVVKGDLEVGWAVFLLRSCE